jgi:pyruvate,water dikinase
VILPDLSPGDVLVAENVGPRWTPLIPILGGLVLDGGALGQHHAITAREFGVPAVVGTRNATRRIPDGAWVTVDGTEGTVTINTPSAS